MALPNNWQKMPSARTWEVSPVYEPLPFSPGYCQAIREIREDEHAPGFSDTGIRNLLFSLVLSLRPESVLELGSHIGSASIVLGEALRLNNFGKLYTVEPQEVYRARLRHYLSLAQLEDWVECVSGFSHEPAVQAKVRRHAPYELIFVDACHDYNVVCEELRSYSQLLGENGVMLLHDTSEHATSFDNGKQGGVRRALLEHCSEETDLKPIFFEYPLWLNNCGAAMVCKQGKLSPSRIQSETIIQGLLTTLNQFRKAANSR